MPTILDKIVAKKREEIERAKTICPSSTLEEAIGELPPAKDFIGELAKTQDVRLIAEVKKASPSAGIIREDFAPVQIAKAYENAGAACVSVLTDESFFQGSLEFLRAIRAEVQLPLLRKDFIIDRYQLLEARAAGADCVLLIAECLTADQMKTLHEESNQLGMQTLIELYDVENLPAVLATGGQLVGVNNRDLRTFETDLQHTVRLRKTIPADRLLVGESGIRSNEDVLMLGASGVKAILVGESLMRQPDIEAAVRDLLGTT